MLDIRATAYVSPVAEVPFTDVPLTVRIVNFADETGYVTGQFRVYNDVTGELIHTSEIAPSSLGAGEQQDVSALTDFSPPAPLDTYFVLFNGHASNALVPDGIDFFLGAFHFDVKPGPLGEPPEAHAPTHEQGGADPIETGDLGTAELDTALRLAPDGAGGVKWDTAAAGGIPAHASTHEAAGADRVLPVTVSVASSATPTPDSDDCDQYNLTALAEAATFAVPAGTPLDGQKLIIRILDDSTPRVLAWNAIYAERGATLPLTTTASKYLYVGLIYNDAETTWDCVAVSEEA